MSGGSSAVMAGTTAKACARSVAGLAGASPLCQGTHSVCRVDFVLSILQNVRSSLELRNDRKL